MNYEYPHGLVQDIPKVNYMLISISVLCLVLPLKFHLVLPSSSIVEFTGPDPSFYALCDFRSPTLYLLSY